MSTLSVSPISRAAQALAQAQQRVQADRRQVQDDEQQLRDSEAALAKSEDALSAQRGAANRPPGDGGASLLALQRGGGGAFGTLNAANTTFTEVTSAPRLGQRLNVQA